MLSQLPRSDAPQTQETKSSHGRMRQPSEKVQAMSGEREHTKQVSGQQAHEKAKRQETSARKREQVRMAAEIDLFMAPTLTATTQRYTASPVDPDITFTTRSVGRIHTTDAITHTGTHVTPLLVRQGRVPPTSRTVSTVNRSTLSQNMPGTVTKPMKTTEILGLKPSQPAMAHGLKHEKGYLNVLDASPPKKRARKRSPTPYPSESQVVSIQLGDLGIDDGNETMQSQDDMDLDDDPLPNKVTHCSVALTDEDEPNNHTMALSLKTTGMGDTNRVGKTRAKVADYDIGTRSIILTAIGIYCVILLRSDPYAPPTKELKWAETAWVKACDHHHVTIPYDTMILGLITVRTSHLRGQFKSKARAVVAAVYGFDASADDSAFVFRTHGKTLDDHRGIYTTPAIQQVINGVLFKNKNGEGILREKYYNPFPEPGFALALTAIECALNEWESGARDMIVFKEHEYSAVFRSHMTSLEAFKKTVSMGLSKRLRQQVYDNGCAHAGVANSGIQTKNAIPDRAFLNAIEEFKSMEGIVDEDVNTKPDDNAEDSPDDMEVENGQADNGDFDLHSDEDLEDDEVADELDDELDDE